jgi:uncharacterized protein YdcH (DUF465 family)
MLTREQKECIMKRIEHLAMKHKLLDDQIDELELKSLHPLPQEIKMVADLKKERLKVRDEIVKAKIEDINGHSRN